MTTYTATGSGCYKVAIDNAALMLSRCATVQLFLGVATEAAALSAIKSNADLQPPDSEEDTPVDMEWRRPRVLVYGKPEEGVATVADAVGSYDSSGTLLCVLERDITPEEHHDDAEWMAGMQTTLGRVTDELWQQVWTDTALVLNAIQMAGPFRGEENTEADLGNRTVGVLELSFGVGRR